MAFLFESAVRRRARTYSHGGIFHPLLFSSITSHQSSAMFILCTVQYTHLRASSHIGTGCDRAQPLVHTLRNKPLRIDILLRHFRAFFVGGTHTSCCENTATIPPRRWTLHALRLHRLTRPTPRAQIIRRLALTCIGL